MNKSNFTLSIGNQKKEFESIGSAMTYAKEIVERNQKSGLSPVFEIKQGNDTVIKFRFRAVRTLETEVISDEIKKRELGETATA